MSILIDENTRFVVQGAAQDQDANWPVPFLASNIVAHVAPEGSERADGNRWAPDGAAVFGSVAEAVAATGANASIVHGGGAIVVAAVESAIEAAIPLVVIASDVAGETERERIRHLAEETGIRVLGPCCPGLISPGACQIGAMPGYIYTRGKIGILSRTGALTYEAALQTTAVGLGQSTVVALGSDPILPSAYVDCFDLFLDDPQTAGIVLLGDAFGGAEDRVVELLRRRGSSKPIVAHIAVDPGLEQRFATDRGAVRPISEAMAARKAESLRSVGAIVTDTPAQIGQIMRSLLEVRAAAAYRGNPQNDFVSAMRQVERVCYDLA